MSPGFQAACPWAATKVGRKAFASPAGAGGGSSSSSCERLAELIRLNHLATKPRRRSKCRNGWLSVSRPTSIDSSSETRAWRISSIENVSEGRGAGVQPKRDPALVYATINRIEPEGGVMSDGHWQLEGRTSAELFERYLGFPSLGLPALIHRVKQGPGGSRQ
jgi:hypothetical protein